ncbi:hypothetical protein ACFW9I_37350 [[Kitasatospora] papulosa]|uniref:hypothetical protein n=1 Tax=[Kitasatospora] papulosa TaxID=1464011 RepID=UPI0036C2D472
MPIPVAGSPPGTAADAYAWRASGLTEYCQGVTVLADEACLHCGTLMPHRKRARRALLPGKEHDTAVRPCTAKFVSVSST